METSKRIGRPPNPDAVRKRKNQTFRIKGATLKQLTEAAKDNLTSVSEEIERRIDGSFENDDYVRSLIDRGPAYRLYVALNKAVEKVLRLSRRYLPEGAKEAPNMSGESKGLLFKHEMATRRELRAAVDLVMQVYAATEERRPLEPGRDGSPIGEWGSGDIARQAVYSWLEWEDDDRLDASKGVDIDSYWTGSGQLIGRLLMKPKDEEWRRYQGPAPAPLRAMGWDEMSDYKPIEVENDVEPAPKRKKRAQKPVSEQ